MKSIFVIVILTGALFFIAGCSSPQKPDPEVEACKSACIKKMELCVKKAGKNEAKKAACEAVGDKCARDCSHKK